MMSFSERTLYVDDEIEIETKSGNFRGCIHHLDKEMLLMKKVTHLDTGVNFPGLRCFCRNEVISGKFIKSGCFQEKSLAQKSKIEEVKRCVEESKAFEEIVYEKSSSFTPARPEYVDAKEKKKETMDKSHYRLNYVVVNKVDRLFYDSIFDIKSSKTIGLAFCGSNLEGGRDFSWVAVHLKDVYLYDVLSLGKLAFKEGLGDIFEDPNIVKVMFDCRIPSRTLHLKHNLLLTNVLDLRVMDVIVESTNQSYHKMPKHLNSLFQSMTNNINLSIEEIANQKLRLKLVENKPDYWGSRMSSGTNGDDDVDDDTYEDMLQGVIFEVLHLKELKKVLMEEMISLVIDGTDIFLSSYRDTQDIRSLVTEKNKVPKEFHDKGVMRQLAKESRKKTQQLIENQTSNEVLNGKSNFSADRNELGKEKKLFTRAENSKIEPLKKDFMMHDGADVAGAGNEFSSKRVDCKFDTSETNFIVKFGEKTKEDTDGRALLSKLVGGGDGNDVGDVRAIPSGSETSLSLSRRHICNGRSVGARKRFEIESSPCMFSAVAGKIQNCATSYYDDGEDKKLSQNGKLAYDDEFSIDAINSAIRTVLHSN